MATKAIDWHWPRAQLAQHYMRMFTAVGAHAMVLFAPRGKGKTEFMTKDVLPLAAKEGFFPIYVNFWDDHANPAASLRYAVMRAAEDAGVMAKMRDVLRRTGVELSLGLDAGPAKFDIKSKTQEKERENATHFQMRQVLDGLLKALGNDSRIFFVFDEVQTLAGKPEHEGFVRSFRTMLDERRGRVCSIFTGSSQGRLTELFARLKAPLYNFAQSMEFPPLGDPFLRHWLRNIQDVSGGAGAAPGLTLEQMRTAFEATDRNPRIFWGAVMAMIQAGSVDIVRHACEGARETADTSGVRQRLAELNPLDRLVLTKVLQNTRSMRDGGPDASEEIFKDASRAEMAGILGLKPTPSQVQGALRRLMADDMQLVVSKERGRYQVEDEFFLPLMEEVLAEEVDPAGSDQAAATSWPDACLDEEEAEPVLAVERQRG